MTIRIAEGAEDVVLSQVPRPVTDTHVPIEAAADLVADSLVAALADVIPPHRRDRQRRAFHRLAVEDLTHPIGGT